MNLEAIPSLLTPHSSLLTLGFLSLSLFKLFLTKFRFQFSLWSQFGGKGLEIYLGFKQQKKRSFYVLILFLRFHFAFVTSFVSFLLDLEQKLMLLCWRSPGFFWSNFSRKYHMFGSRVNFNCNHNWFRILCSGFVLKGLNSVFFFLNVLFNSSNFRECSVDSSLIQSLKVRFWCVPFVSSKFPSFLTKPWLFLCIFFRLNSEIWSSRSNNKSWQHLKILVYQQG